MVVKDGKYLGGEFCRPECPIFLKTVNCYETFDGVIPFRGCMYRGARPSSRIKERLDELMESLNEIMVLVIVQCDSTTITISFLVFPIIRVALVR